MAALDRNAHTLVTRQYFADRTQRPAELQIETLDPQPPSAVPDEKQTARSIRGLAESVTRTLAATEAASELWLERPNEVSVDSTADDWASSFATPDNDYVGGWYALAEDEALVMEGLHRRAVTERAVVGRWLESRDYVSRRVILEYTQVPLAADAPSALPSPIAIGSAHWLDTAGHPEGGAIFRWLLPEGDRERPTFRVIKI